MGCRLEFVLEHDGENPVRNDFVCEIDDWEFPSLKRWEDLYGGNVLGKYPAKKHSVKTLKYSDWHGCYSWDINAIIPQIEIIKKEMEIDTELDENDKELLRDIINNLQGLYDLAIEKCCQNNLDPQKCYLVWWLNY